MNVKQLIALITASVLILYIIVQNNVFLNGGSKTPPLIVYETNSLYNKKEVGNDNINELENLPRDNQVDKLSESTQYIVTNISEIPFSSPPFTPTIIPTNLPSNIQTNPTNSLPLNSSLNLPSNSITNNPENQIPLLNTLPQEVTKFLQTTINAETTIAKPLTRREITWPIKSNQVCNKSNTIRTGENGRWYDYGRDDFVLYTYSALVDDRDSLQSGPLIRIIAISSNLNRPIMRCRLYFPLLLPDNETKRDLIMDVEVERYPDRFVGMGWPLNGKLAREIIYSCPLPEKKEVLKKLETKLPGKNNLLGYFENNQTVKDDYLIPSWVGMLVGEEKENYKYENITSCMPVEISKKVEKVEKFAICVQVAFNNIDATKLVVWLELQKLLGINRIGIYDQNIDKPAMEVFKYYAEEGLVDLRRSDYIPHGLQQYMLHGSPVINDCMYRHIHTHEYMFVYDLDEVILPVNDQLNKTFLNFHDLLRELQRTYKDNDSLYAFRNRYFFFDHPPNPSESQGFYILRYKMAAPISKYGYSTKCLVNMQACIQMHNHFCWGATKTYTNMPANDVSPRLASNQHYKKCHLKHECDQMIKESKEYDAINAYKSDLIKNVNTAIAALRRRLKLAQIDDPFNEFSQ